MAVFSEDIIEAVWSKAFPQVNNNPDAFRQDYAGAWIKRDDYGSRDSVYGWEIDHLKPKEKGGTDDINNLIPLHWRNNVAKGNHYPRWQTSYSSQGVDNEELTKHWHV
ncbi:MAG: HNH endonuclease [Bacteroidales bacterium]|nr:HNH endonuclease [Bacteroidales bacterium]MCM1146220.1 HNH endonuclease [Bacteroidales bacterium]MCM1205342.1 HNH endonuclease [Bacillota bacterium]MCM1509571.1 HNH endonuclease [Clostridium sp.]